MCRSACTLLIMDEDAAADCSACLVNHGEPPGAVMLLALRRALVRAELYHGETVILELDVIALAAGYVCVRQDRTGRPPWLAWLPADDATPLQINQ